MTVAETILVFVGIPLAVYVLLALLIFLPGGRKRTRYKPGQPWDHAPIWYEPHPENVGAGGHEPAPGAAAVPGSSSAALGSSMYPEQPEERNTDTSRASDAHGAGGHGAHVAPRPVNAGPLGGARGTW
ncbi:aa3-type cytochrome oxidase subunit CtaJ [Blastococcus mobilis]|uniref:aa3-type cytochrome oxidase subunit CtaJ n=1 Tax=Blastococcus mobilis TaxID=1938746 RepID=UPI000B7745E4|nr:hypothetical protein [Blastococcus mobilis]